MQSQPKPKVCVDLGHDLSLSLSLLHLLVGGMGIKTLMVPQEVCWLERLPMLTCATLHSACQRCVLHTIQDLISSSSCCLASDETGPAFSSKAGLVKFGQMGVSV